MSAFWTVVAAGFACFATHWPKAFDLLALVPYVAAKFVPICARSCEHSWLATVAGAGAVLSAKAATGTSNAATAITSRVDFISVLPPE